MNLLEFAGFAAVSICIMLAIGAIARWLAKED